MLCWVFGLEYSKTSHICNQRPPICLIAKFRAKIREFLNLEPKMPSLCVLESNFEKLLSFL